MKLEELRKNAFTAFKELPLELPRDSPIEKNYTRIQLELEKFQPEMPVLEIEVLSGQPVIEKIDSAKALELLGGLVKPDSKLSAMHYNGLEQGLVVYASKNSKSCVKVHVTGSEQGKHYPHHLVILVDEGAELEIVQASNSGDKESVHSTVVEAYQKKGSRLKYYEAQNLGLSSFHYAQRKAMLEKDAKITWVVGDFGARQVLSSTDSVLAGEGSESENLGVFFSSQSQHHDIANNAQHTVPGTNNKTLVKGAVNGKANAVCRGVIDIKREAPQTQSHLAQHVLMLSKTAKANALPTLEIKTNDVQSKHSASISQLDQDQLFYLMSRGIERKQAERLVVEGFFDPVISRIESPQAQGLFRVIIAQKAGENVQP